MIDRDIISLGPESVLRETIDEIVGYFAEPTNFYASKPIFLMGEEFPIRQEFYISNDTIAHREIGSAGAQILTQEIADPDLDDQLPFHVILRAVHQLGTVYAHITVPTFVDPLLRPSDRQKGRPSIAVNVDSQTKAHFDQRFILNALLGELTPTSKDHQLVELLAKILRPVRDKKTEHLTEEQMLLIEKYLSEIFWSDEQQTIPNGERPKLRNVYRSLVAKYVHIRYGL